MKMLRLTILLSFFIGLFLQIQAQDATERKWEIGLDLTPVIVLPFSSAGNQPGIELSIRRKISENEKLRFRCFNNYEENLALFKDGRIFSFTEIEPSADGTPRFIANVNYQDVNNGISIGYQRDISINGINIYYGMDVQGQISRGTVFSEVLEENQQPYPRRSNLVFNVPEFDGVINDYYNYQIGVIPALGVDMPLGERINFSIEFGARIAYFQQNIPYSRAVGTIERATNRGMFIEANPIKDIIIAYRF